MTEINIYNVDLHYHAGKERQDGVSLYDYLDYAQKTDRRILGLTDHYGLYFPRDGVGRDRTYPASLDGLLQYREDVAHESSKFPDLKILFAPELSPKDDLAAMPREVIAVSDYFISEPDHTEGLAENTASMQKRLFEVADFREKTGKPVFLAHPFRQAVNNRLVKAEIEPWVSRLDYRPWQEYDYSTVRDFFGFEIKQLARTARELDIPVEVNGNTQYRVRSANSPAALQLLWAALAFMLGEGASLVPGSDLHGFKAGVGNIGQYVPQDCFEALGQSLADITFLAKIS